MRNASSPVVHRRIRAAMRASRRGASQHGATERGKILVVEHDLATRETLAMMLKYYGYDVTVAGDGREATRLLGEVTPAV